MPPKAAAPKANQRQTPPPEGGFQPRGGGDAAEDALGDDYDMPVIVKVRPDDQLNLPPEAPQAGKMQYSFKEKCFKVDEQAGRPGGPGGDALCHGPAEGKPRSHGPNRGLCACGVPRSGAVLEKKEAEQNEKEEAEAIDEDFDPPENEKARLFQSPGVLQSPAPHWETVGWKWPNHRGAGSPNGVPWRDASRVAGDSREESTASLGVQGS
eukprot:Skav200472  [mRNA]  locus=scaffold5182:77845:81563:- [translate_table: standard]